MVAYESGAGRNIVRMAAYDAEDGPYRLRSVSEAAWATRPRHDTLWDKTVFAFVAAGRLVLPVLLLLTAFAAIYLYRGQTAPYLAERVGNWLSISHLILPLAFFSLHLTNRRYGPGYAFAQLLTTMVLAVAAILGAHSVLVSLVPADLVPSARLAASFGVAFFAAAFISILVFDGARGRHWWPAPLFGTWAAALIFPAVFFSAAYAGLNTLWIDNMLLYAGLLAVAGIALLIPYWMLRKMVPPLSGYGGY